MAITGLYANVFAAPDMKTSKAFFADWGLKKISDSRAGAVFQTSAGSRVMLRPPSSRLLPKPARDGMNFREMIWGVSSKSHLAKIRRELEKDREVTVNADGTIHCYDPAGIGLGFTLWKPKKNASQARTKMNSYDMTERLDQLSTFYDRATPIRMGHIGFVLPDIKAAEHFYRDRLGFWVSDRYAGGAAVFLRCAETSQHHNMFLIWSEAGNLRYHHTAYEVRDIHEVFGGGRAFDRKGWATEVGPGRHPVSSAYFWYFKNPCDGAVEYFADSDVATKNWKVHNYRINRFSEWHLVDGIPNPDDVRVRPSMSAAGKQ
jgi:catechol 2,3-dioxygenase-like lactoylglutathione lyase family enzyme